MRRRVQVGLVGFVALSLAACPLPFQFTPSQTTGSVASSNDPANPSVTAAPDLLVTEITSGTAIADSEPEIVASRNIRVSMESETRGAVFFYTTNGNEPIPGEDGTVRFDPEDPIVFDDHDEGATVRAIAIGPSMYPSVVTTRSIRVAYEQVVAPTFSPAPGNYETDQLITLSTSTPEAQIWYTTAPGTGGAPLPEPGEPDTRRYDGTPIAVEGTGTALSIAAIATKSEMRDSSAAQGVFTIGYDGAAQPTIDPRGGTYTSDQSVTITTAEPGGEVYYTLVDGPGPAPTPAVGQPGTVRYTGPITIAGSGTQKSIAAITVADQRLPSVPVRATYTVAYEQLSPPSIDPPGTTFTAPVAVTITSEAGATIWYTVDDTTPQVGGGGSTQSGPSPVQLTLSNPGVVRAVATKAQRLTSEVAVESFRGTTAPPVFAPTGYYVPEDSELVISTETADATIYYTITNDGSVPAVPEPGQPGTSVYDGAPIALSGLHSHYRVRAVATAPFRADSTVTEDEFLTLGPVFVTNTSSAIDTGDGITLAEALTAIRSPGQQVGDLLIQNSPYPHLVTFDESLGNPTYISVTNGGLLVSNEVIVAGDPQDNSRIRISGGGASRVFHIVGGDVTIRDLTIVNGTVIGESAQNGPSNGSAGGGEGAIGGAVLVDGDATQAQFQRVRFADNYAQGGSGGNGAEIVNGDFTAPGGPGAGFYGGSGGADNGGAGGDANGFLGGGGAGGSASASPGAGGAGGFGGGGGGGGAKRSGGLAAPGGSGGAFGGNGGQSHSSATSGGGGGAGLGAGIFIRQGSVVVEDSVFVRNWALGGAAGSNWFGDGTLPQPGRGEGGAVFVYSGATFSESGNTYQDNRGRDGAGVDNGEPDVYVMP